MLVLGAGNVSSIPATDTISKVFQEGHVVLLKMNPVNEYLGPIFERLFARLIDAGLRADHLRRAPVGAAAVDHPRSTRYTSPARSTRTTRSCGDRRGRSASDANASNDPLLKKPITSELGNVSPWIVVPGPYSARQLQFQAENVAASITNNASFNCVATKVIVTWKDWPQRQRVSGPGRSRAGQGAAAQGLLSRRARSLRPVRGQAAAGRHGDALPWTLVRDADLQTSPHLFCEESFVCVCAEIGLEAADEKDFLARAVTFANEKLWGTLSAALTVHPSFRGDAAGEASFQAALANLRYGAVGVNHWPALVYAMMSPPWGGYPSGTLADAQSGIGSVHNTFMLRRRAEDGAGRTAGDLAQAILVSHASQSRADGLEGFGFIRPALGLEVAGVAAGGAQRLTHERGFRLGSCDRDAT